MHYKFIDIGCAATNTSVDTYGLDVHGLLIEPVEEYCRVLPKSNKVKVVNLGVSTFDGKQLMNIVVDNVSNYVPKQILQDPKFLKKYVARRGKIGGISSFLDEDINPYLKETPKDRKKARYVDVVKLSTLVQRYEISTIDHLKIDVEGYEEVILLQLLELLKDKVIDIKYSITFEYNNLGNKKKLDLIRKELEDLYGFESKYVENKDTFDKDYILTKPHNV